MKKETFKKHNTKRGYTIIETMVAISVFLVIVMLGIGTLLNASVLHQKSRDMRSILDNLSFVMEDMARNLRVGSHYHCVLIASELTTNLANLANPVSGNSCSGIAFQSAPTGGVPGLTWIYSLASSSLYNPTGSGTLGIFKSADGGVTWVQMNPDEVVLSTTSKFDVLGALPPPGDKQQPFVNIRISGTITTKGVSTPFSLQTSVSQRTIDI